MVHKSLLLLLLALSLFSATLSAQDGEEDLEEIFVFLRVERIGAYEFNAIYSYETERLYLPVLDLFRVLQINIDVSGHNDIYTGFLLDENIRYRIDYPEKQIQIGNRTIPLNEEDILYTLSGLYLYTGIFGPAFGLDTRFDFRSMSVLLRTDLELPAIREMRLNQMRQNVERLRGIVEVDTTLFRRYHVLRMGMADWAVYAQQTDGVNDDARLSLGIGSEFLGGETNLFLNYSTRDGFDERRQQYQWRWVNNNTRLVKQLRAGKISATNAISSLYAPMLGVMATNTPSTFRRSFGEYTLTDFTEPGWTVELYVNNVLVDYATADASGFFQFDVPMIYGTTEVMLKFYGPYGEERTREQYMNIPYNFIPQGEIEYTISGGSVQDRENTLFSRAEAFYGLTRSLTVGGGYEYLSNKPVSLGSSQELSDTEKEPIQIPFMSAAANLFGRMLVSGEYAHNVRTKALLSIRLPSNLVLDLDYAVFEEDQQAIRFNYLEERRARLSIPIQIGRFRMQSRIGLRQNVYEQFTYNTGDMLLSTSIGRVSTSISGFATWIDGRTPFISSNLSMGIRLPRGITLRPQAQLDVTNSSLTTLRMDVEKRIGRVGFLSVGYDENVRMGQRAFSINFRYDLPFAQASAASRISSQTVNTAQGIRGSMAFGSGNRHLHVDNRSMVGRGGITIVPFVDTNHNGIRDAGEPLATGLNVRLNGGRTLRGVSDSLIRIVELEPYTSYLMQLDESSLENIAWRLEHKTKSIYIDPNQFKVVEIPVLPMGEVSGTVYLERDGRQRPLGRVLINIYHDDGRLFTQTMTEPDGYFINMQLPPGNYYLTPDIDQLKRMGVTTDQDRIDFEVIPDEYGDIVYGLDLVLYAAPEEAAAEVTIPLETVPEEVAPEETIPTETVPTEVVPEVTIPTETEPIETVPEEPVPTETVPTETVPTTDIVTPEPVTDHAEALRQFEGTLQQNVNAALRLFIEAQHATYSRDYERAIMLADQSLAHFVTGQALALKGTIHYLTGNTELARSFWQQASELVPGIEVPEIDPAQQPAHRE